MTAKRFIVVDLLETLAIADDVECKYYQNDDDDFESLCEALNDLNDKNKELKEFIRNLTNFKGEILLRNGRAYKREYVERLLE